MRLTENENAGPRPRSVECEVDGEGLGEVRDGQSSADWNVKIKFSESASELQNNENECFGESELKGRKLDIKWF